MHQEQDAADRYAAAESAFAAGDSEGALRRLDQLIGDYPRERYPANDWRAAALARAGEIEMAMGRVPAATARFVDVIEGEDPSAWTSRARLGLATALLWRREWPAAATLLQQVVDAFGGDDASGDPLAGTLAADRLTLLHRVWLRVAAGEQPWQRSGRLDVGAALDRPIGVAAGPNGLLVSDEGRDAVIFRDSAGNAASFPLPDGQRPWWSDRGEAYVAARALVGAPLSGATEQFSYGDNGRQRAVQDIRAGVRLPTGAWLLLDQDSRRVLVFSATGAYERALDLRGGEPVDLEAGPGGRLYVIEKNRREVVTFDAAGALQGGFAVDGWREPYALAVDPAGHVYVLDRGNKRIDVFDPDGGILWTLGPVLPGGVQLDDPRDIAVGGGGRILVADRGLRVVVVIE
jgi:tetratricopeptide (TPR) repeat protein